MTNANEKTRKAAEKAGKFRNLHLAQNLADRQTKLTSVLLGDDGRYWVPETPADMERLLKAGYQAAR